MLMSVLLMKLDYVDKIKFIWKVIQLFIKIYYNENSDVWPEPNLILRMRYLNDKLKDL